MLVLSRQRDESIMIGDNIVVTIVDIRGDKVRLGINAPTEIPVHRQEVYEAIQRENLRASRLEPKGYAAARQKRTAAQRARPGSAQARSLIVGSIAIRLNSAALDFADHQPHCERVKLCRHVESKPLFNIGN